MIRRTIVTTSLVTGLFLVAEAYAVPSVMTGNPYQPIVDRNPFGLKPLPPPVDATTNAPPSKIKLIGIANMIGTLKVILKNEDAPKAGQPPPDPFVLSVGQAQQDIEVKAINEKAKTATVINHGIEATLKLDEDVKLAAGPAPGAPAPAAGFSGIPGPRPFSQGAPAGMPTQPRAMGAGGGGSTAAPSAPAATSLASFGGQGATTFGAQGASAAGPIASFGGGGSIPARPVRNTSSDTASLAQQFLAIELQRDQTRDLVKQGKFPPLPPTPITPIEDTTPLAPPPPMPPGME